MQLEVYEATRYIKKESQDREAPSAAQRAEIPKLDTSVTVWLILFVFGGGLLALYYGGIGYFPEVTWQDALTYMALMTIIGGSLLVAYSFLLFVPGAIWSELLIFDKQLREVLMMSARELEPCVWSITKRIVFPFALFMAFCHFLLFLLNRDGSPAGFVALGAAASLLAVTALLVRDFREGLELVAKKKAGEVSPPADALPDSSKLSHHRWAILASHVPLLVAFIGKAGDMDWAPAPTVLWASAGLPFLSFAGLLLDWGRERRRRRQERQVKEPEQLQVEPEKTAPRPSRIEDKWSLLCRAVMAFGTAALLSLAALWFFYRIYRGEPDAGSAAPSWRLLLLCTLVVIVTNLAVSVLFRHHPSGALLASFLAALLLLGAGQLLSGPEGSLPARIMAKFGFGVPQTTLVLTQKGGWILCQHGFPAQFEQRTRPEIMAASSQASGAPVTQEGTPGNSGKAAEDKSRQETLLSLSAGVTILSRLGSEYLLKYGDRRVTLPKGEVVSWSAVPAGAELNDQHPGGDLLDCRQFSDQRQSQ